MVILEDRPVVVEDGEVGARVDVEVVGRAGVVKVVDDGRHQAGENLQIGEPRLKKRGGMKIEKKGNENGCHSKRFHFLR